MSKRFQFGTSALIAIAVSWLLWSYSGFWETEISSDAHINKTKAALINGRSSTLVTDNKQRRKVPTNMGTLSHDEAIRRVSNDLDKLSALVGPSKKTENRNNKLTNRQQAQLDELERLYSAKKPTKALFNKSNELVALFPNLEITGLSDLPTYLMAYSIKSLVDNNPDLFGLNDVGVSDATSECVGSICRTIIKKSFGRLPAWDHELVLATNKSQLFSVQGVFNAPDITRFTSERLSDSQIKEYVSEHYKVDQAQLEFKTQPELGIARDNNRDFLAYKIEVKLSRYEMFDIYLDVDTKKIQKEISLVHQAQVPAVGIDLNGSQVSFQVEQSDNFFYLKDSRFPIGYDTHIYNAAGKIGTEDNPIENVDYIASNSDTTGWDAASVSAVNNAKTLIDYFKSEHSYNVVADIAIGVNLGAESGSAYRNNALAYSGLNIFAFGAGDGVYKYNFAKSLDVMAHEITHGVISATSQLVYRNQSGALNESFADFFAAMLDPDDWYIGEDLYIAPNSIMRNMANPGDSRSEYPQPSHMANYDFRVTDNGGVHINSGIFNRALYQLAEGLDSSIGRSKTANIVFNTMIALSRNSTFDQAATTMIAMTGSLYPNSSEAESTELALQSVGLPEDIYSDVSSTSYSSASNAAVYLYPYNSPSNYLPSDASSNSYSVYVQDYFNETLAYQPDNDFGPLNKTEYAALMRPTLIFLSDGNYRFMYKGKSSGKLYVYDSSTASESELVLNGYTISDITLSRDYKTLVFTTYESPIIFVYDYTSEELSSYPVSGNSTSELTPKGVQADYVDTVRFDPTQRYIVFDYFTCGFSSEACNGDSPAGYWAIGLMEVSTGRFFYPFPSQPPNIDVGYPAFSNKSDRFIVFDLIDNAASTPSGYDSGVYLFDLYEGGSLQYIGDTDDTTSAFGYYGTPSFTSDDTGVVFSWRTDTGSTFWHRQISSYQSLGGSYSVLNNYPVYLPMSIDKSAVDREPTLTLAETVLDFGEMRSGSTANLELCATNSGNFPISVNSFSAGNPALKWTANRQTILGGQKVCGQVRFNSGLYSSGLFNATVSLVHDGANSPLPISINAKFTLDTDNDGTIDSIDTDDDGDGLADTQEATYGTNPLLTDTDGDGFSDYEEITNGTDPLDANSAPMSGLSLILIKAFLDQQEAAQQSTSE